MAHGRDIEWLKKKQNCPLQTDYNREHIWPNSVSGQPICLEGEVAWGEIYTGYWEVVNG